MRYFEYFACSAESEANCKFGGMLYYSFLHYFPKVENRHK